MRSASLLAAAVVTLHVNCQSILSLSLTASLIPLPLPSATPSSTSKDSIQSLQYPHHEDKYHHSQRPCVAPVPATNETPVFSTEQLFLLTQRFHDNFLYPNNLAQASHITSPLLADNCQGRVDVTRNFEGAELNTEYIFGSFGYVGETNSLNLLGVPLSYNMTHWTGFQNVVSSAVTFQILIPIINVTLPLELWTWFTFNSAGQVNQYDATFRYIEFYVDTILELGATALKADNITQAADQLSGILIENICMTHQSYCNGTNSQYTDFNCCVKYLTKSVPLGKSYQIGEDTLLCRMVHQTMVKYRPEVHCPHIGPGGGGYCVNDFTYQNKVEAPYFVLSSWMPRLPMRMRTTEGPLPVTSP